MTERKFTLTKARRSQVPLLIGLVGPSGSGKTLSALHLASGIGGRIAFIDTEAGRALHYADDFDFMHLPFEPPFSPLDYLAAIEHCVRERAQTIIIDTMSHEHEGPGGVLEWHAAEVEKFIARARERGRSEPDWKIEKRVTMLAWQKPKAARTHLIHRVLQLGINLVMCFRAREKLKLVTGQDPVQMGWMPIGGDEFWFEQTTRCFLPPNADGVPQWRSDKVGESIVMKLPRQFRGILDDGKPLSEEHGRKMAAWARGDARVEPTAEARQDAFRFKKGPFAGKAPDDAAVPTEYLHQVAVDPRTPEDLARVLWAEINRREGAPE